MDGENNQIYDYKELNDSTSHIFHTNLQKYHLKSGNEKIAEIVTDSLKPIEVNSNDDYNPEAIICSVNNMNENVPMKNVSNSEQFIDLNCNSERSDLKFESSDDENEAELHAENVSRHLLTNTFPNQKTEKNNEQINAKIKLTDFGQSNSRENISESNSPSYLPDVLSSLNKSEADYKRCKSDSPNKDPESIPKPKSVLTQTSYVPKQLKSEALQSETETELKELKNLHSLQSIYKFAYDENVTDQSDAGSKSPSPLDPESNVPSSLTSDEIIIHEADSGSDAGSEDVELIPHRYESETFLSRKKHMYVNKLSLAVELLRTQEKLPYDDEFKRVTGENIVCSKSDSTEGTRLSLVEDLTNSKTLTSQSQVRRTFKGSSDTREGSLDGFHVQEGTGTERGNRKFGVRQYISQKTAVSMDPWICCTIM